MCMGDLSRRRQAKQAGSVSLPQNPASPDELGKSCHGQSGERPERCARHLINSRSTLVNGPIIGDVVRPLPWVVCAAPYQLSQYPGERLGRCARHLTNSRSNQAAWPAHAAWRPTLALWVSSPIPASGYPAPGGPGGLVQPEVF